MSTKPTILVTSAAGKTGLPLALQLLRNGYPVRAFVRREDARSKRLETEGAEVFVGDQYLISDMRHAMRGIQRAYHCAPTAPNGLLFNAVFIAAASENQLEHIVTLGQWLSTADHPSMFTREVYLSDKLVRLAGATVTQVNPGWFADNYLMGLRMAANIGILAMPLGDGQTRKNAPPSNEDIAAVAAGALMDPARHVGKSYRPTGPELMSPNEIAAAMGRALGRRVRYMDVSTRMMTKALRSSPPSNYSVAGVTQLAIYAEEYRRGTFAVNAPTKDVQNVGGKAPDTFEAIVRRRLQEEPGMRATLSGRVAGVAGFAKMLLTPALDLPAEEARRDYFRPPTQKFAQDSDEWRKSHTSAPALIARAS